MMATAQVVMVFN